MTVPKWNSSIQPSNRFGNDKKFKRKPTMENYVKEKHIETNGIGRWQKAYFTLTRIQTS